MEQIKQKVDELLKHDQSGHGNDHIERVLELSLRFCEKENANKEVVTYIALLHDVDDYKLFGKENAENLPNATRILNACNIDETTKQHVLSEIKRIGYSKALKGIRPITIEGKIVSDADMCDAMGAHGLLRCYAYSMKIKQPFFDRNLFPIENISQETYTTYDSTSVNHLFEKILKLKDYMLTNEGKIESLKRHQIVVDFLKQFFYEENANEWLEYLENHSL